MCIRDRVWSERENVGQLDWSLEALKKAMKWDEDVYGLEYDLDVYHIVAVNDFNMGAMENKGLNVFNTACVLAAPETATDGDVGGGGALWQKRRLAGEQAWFKRRRAVGAERCAARDRLNQPQSAARTAPKTMLAHYTPLLRWSLALVRVACLSGGRRSRKPRGPRPPRLHFCFGAARAEISAAKSALKIG